MKYRDYAAGAGTPEIMPIIVDRNLDALPLDGLINDNRVSEVFVDDVFDAIKESVEVFDGRQSVLRY